MARISIHAPLSGVRRASGSMPPRRQNFNPRTPERGATYTVLAAKLDELISIHAPLSGVRLKSY